MLNQKLLTSCTPTDWLLFHYTENTFGISVEYRHTLTPYHVRFEIFRMSSHVWIMTWKNDSYCQTEEKKAAVCIAHALRQRTQLQTAMGDLTIIIDHRLKP